MANMPNKTDLTGNPSTGTFKLAIGKLYDFVEQYLPIDGSKPAASNVANTPSGNITGTDVQAALNELDSEKLAVSGGNLTGAINETIVTITSAATVNIGAAAANVINITGTTAITAFDLAQAGTRRILVFSGILTLTHNATSLILPGAANISTAVGDSAEFVSLGSGNWRCTRYTRADGTALVSNGGGSPGMTDYIASGRKFSVGSDLNLTVSAGVDAIGEEKVERDANTVTLNARRAQLIYDTGDGATGIINAAFPAADSWTVGRWIIDGSATIASTVGTNNLTKTGTITQVNGWASDYAGQGDGSTGYYTMANATGFPSGAAVREIDIVFMPTTITGMQCLFSYGIYAGSEWYGVYSNNGNIYVYADGSTALNAGFALEAGKLYYLAVAYDGAYENIYVNGTLVYRAALTRNTTLNAGYILAANSAGDKSSATVHYVELRNALRTPVQIAAISNALLLPCRYDPPTTQELIPVMASNSQNGYVASASSTSNAAYLTFDGNAATECQTTAGVPGWFQMQFPQAIKPSYAILKWNYTGEKTGNISYSDNGTDWTIAAPFSSSGYTAGAALQVNFPVWVGTHAYWRTTLTGYAGSAVATLAEFQLYETLATRPYTDIRAILPADSIALGFVHTDAAKVAESNDTDYKYGRREGATGGNRRVFSGWKYFTANNSVFFDNPFGTSKVKRNYFFASDAGGRNECPAERVWYNGTTYGIEELPTTNPDKMRVYPYNGVVKLNDAWQTSGFLGCYAEVIE